MRNLQKLIPLAIEAIENKRIVENINEVNKIDKEYNGYISSLGGSIISSGLLPSMIFYSQKAGAQSDRPKIIAAIEYVIQRNDGNPNFKLLEKVKELYTGNINQNNINILTKKVEDAMIALKLAIRIYEKK